MTGTSSARAAFAPLLERLSLPVLAAPMFLVSGPALAEACGKAGILCGLPTLNAREPETLEQWLADADMENGSFIPNLIVHRSNPRAETDLALIAKYKPRIVISALGSPAPVVEVVHKYGGLVLCDVGNMKLARKAIAAGVDGLILVCSGAGGHTGQLSPFAFIPAVRAIFDGLIVAGGGVSTGAGIRAMELLGADVVSMGTHFIAAQESLASDAYRQMLVDADVEDIVLSAHFTGVPANYLWPSIEAAGVSRDALDQPRGSIKFDDEDSRAKAWKDIWSAGQGVGGTCAIEPLAEIVARLSREYHAVSTLGTRIPGVGGQAPGGLALPRRHTRPA
jgi:nitronate monooxygenase